MKATLANPESNKPNFAELQLEPVKQPVCQVKATNLQSVHDLVWWVAQMARKCAAQPGTATFRFDVQGGAAAAAGLGKPTRTLADYPPPHRPPSSVHSPDLGKWEFRCILLLHPDVVRRGFKYLGWHFGGDDPIILCRTAHDDHQDGTRNHHDPSFLTFQRWYNLPELSGGGAHQRIRTKSE